MAYQSIYTSVKSGLAAGRSGFCTAARHREIRDALAARIEDISSQYERGRRGESHPVIYSHRIETVRDATYHLLMRVADAGNDYSGRTNHIAHSIVVEPAELVRVGVTPAEAILRLAEAGTWRTRWDEPARFFDAEEEIDLAALIPLSSLPANHWQQQTGDAAMAAALHQPAAASGAAVAFPERYEPEELLRLFAESALLLSPHRSDPAALWSKSFTTLLQDPAGRSGFDWAGCLHGDAVHGRAEKSGGLIVDLAPGGVVPAGPLADLSRTGAAVAPERETSPAQEGLVVDPTLSGPPAGATATVIEESPPPATPEESKRAVAAVPSDLLPPPAARPPRRTKKKSRTGAVLAIVALAVTSIGAGAILFLQPARVAEREIGAKVGQGDWASAAESLDALPEEDRTRFADGSARFDSLVSAIDRYREFRKMAESASARPGPFLADPSLRGQDPVLRLESARSAFRAAAREVGSGDSSTPALDGLFAEAEQSLHGYAERQREHGRVWRTLLDLSPEVPDSTALRSSADQVGGDVSALLDEIAVIESVVPAVRSFSKATTGTGTREELVKAVGAADVALRSAEMKAAGKPWSKYVSAIRAKIAAHEIPAPKPPAPKVVAETRKSEPGDTAAPQEPVAAAAPLVYLVPHLPGADRISYEGIPPLADGFLPSLSIRPAVSRPTGVMEFKKELAEINGEPTLYHFTGSKTVKIFRVDEATKELRLDEGFHEAFPQGFAIGFGPEGEGEPDFLLVGQVPSPAPGSSASPNAPFLERMPLAEGIDRGGEGSPTVALSPSARETMSRILFPGASARYHLLVEKENSVLRADAESPPELRLALAAGLDETIARAEAATADYAAKKDVAERFGTAFADLGARLFGLKEGKATTEGLKTAVVPRPGKPPTEFQLVADPESMETIPTEIHPTLEAYLSASGDFVEGPPFLHYLGVHLFDALWHNAVGSSRRVTADAKNELREAFQSLIRTDDEADSLAAAMASLRSISAIAEKYGLAEPPANDEIYPSQKDAEEARKRREKSWREEQILARFFSEWTKVFTAENLALAEESLLAGAGVGFDPAELERMQIGLDELRKRRSSLAATPLEDLGEFSVWATVSLRGGREVVYRLLSFESGR